MDGVVVNDGAAGPWAVDHAVCLVCTYKWIAVYPLSCTEIECPSCNSTLTEPYAPDAI